MTNMCPIHPKKQRFVTHGEANDAARNARRKTKIYFRAYECPGCGCFHLSTSQRR